MNEEQAYEELLKAAQLLRAVRVDGEYWLTMHAVFNSIVQAAEAIKPKKEGDEA